ncbi:MAG: phage virion morphogenesis protein [Candidatus Contendobacter sp.]
MAGSFIEITLDDAEISQPLEKLQAKLGDLTPVFRDLGEALIISHRERFVRAVAPDGTPWPALSPRYRASKKKNPDKILVLDGWLRQLHYQAAPDALRIGTDRSYGGRRGLPSEYPATPHGAPIKTVLRSED